MTTRLTIRKPDDWHLHVRDGAMLKAVLQYTARNFGRAILMPNLIPPVRTTKDAVAYRERVLAALPAGSTFKPLLTCYLADDTDPDDVEASLDDILKDRLVIEDDGPDDDDDETPDLDDRGEGASVVIPRRPDEFVCQSCFLVKHVSQIADDAKQLCRDCV